MLQQQQQLAKQQQIQIAQQLGQQRARSPQLTLQQQQQIQQQINQQKLNQLQQQQQQQHPMPPSSPMAPNSPMLLGQKSPAHGAPQSPMISGGIVYNQPPHSPMPRSPAVMHQLPPSSPMLQQQLQQPPSSPMPRSPMIGGSPMQIMRPPSNSNTLCSPERPLSVENPHTPRTYAPQLTPNIDRPESRGGGNPHNPHNPTPIDYIGRFGFKLGLRGGSPMWSYGKGAKRIPQMNTGAKDPDKPSTSDQKVKKESHLSKVSILKKKSPRKLNDALIGSKVGSLVCAEYNEFDDSSSTPPISPPPMGPAGEKKQLKLKIAGKKAPEDVLENSECVVVDSSPEEKHMQCNMDSDDDIDKALVTSEVSLNSVAQSCGDIDDITVVESFSQQDLANVISSPLETGVAEEYVLFSSDMVGDLSVDCEDSLKQIMEGKLI